MRCLDYRAPNRRTHETRRKIGQQRVANLRQMRCVLHATRTLVTAQVCNTACIFRRTGGEAYETREPA